MRAQRGLRHGFSLIELVVVIAVAVTLTGLLMPAMRALHENAHRVICLANLQQMGQGFVIYGSDYNDRLPFSVNVHQYDPPLTGIQNLMASRMSGPGPGWDGMGLLYGHGYCTTAECFYCPSHHGSHPYERYADRWSRVNSNGQIYTNYHYAGHRDWKRKQIRMLTQGHDLVLATDGLRTAMDFNHGTGMNVLRADCSVRWREDTDQIYLQLPVSDFDPPSPQYSAIWESVGGTH